MSARQEAERPVSAEHSVPLASLRAIFFKIFHFSRKKSLSAANCSMECLAGHGRKWCLPPSHLWGILASQFHPRVACDDVLRKPDSYAKGTSPLRECNHPPPGGLLRLPADIPFRLCQGLRRMLPEDVLFSVFRQPTNRKEKGSRDETTPPHSQCRCQARFFRGLYQGTLKRTLDARLRPTHNVSRRFCKTRQLLA